MAPLPSRLPPLDLLRGFVAVGRRMSITLAANDLCVTQSAVSRQIRELEERIGTQLFIRSFRAIQFTDVGAQLFLRANAALQDLQDALGSVIPLEARKRVTLTTTAGIARLWLMPRLGALRAQHPDIDLHITTDNRVLDLRLERIDLAIRYLTTSRPPETAIHLFSEQVAPVLSPRLLTDATLDLRECLPRLVLLELADAQHPQLSWHNWLAERGLDASWSAGVLRFNHYDQVIQAAADGHGIAIGRHALVEQLLASGQLSIWPTEAYRCVPDCSFALVAKGGMLSGGAQRVADWIAAEARDSLI